MTVTITEFLNEQQKEDFPSNNGAWIEFDRFDPPFTIGELRAMRRSDIIELDEPNKRYRLTLKATKSKFGAMEIDYDD